MAEYRKVLSLRDAVIMQTTPVCEDSTADGGVIDTDYGAGTSRTLSELRIYVACFELRTQNS